MYLSLYIFIIYFFLLFVNIIIPPPELLFVCVCVFIYSYTRRGFYRKKKLFARAGGKRVQKKKKIKTIDRAVYNNTLHLPTYLILIGRYVSVV